MQKLEQNIQTETLKKSELTAKNAFDFQKIAGAKLHFLQCDYEETDETIMFHFNVDRMKCVSGIKNDDILNRYRFLINFSRLKDAWMQYRFSLSPDNIYFDENFIPYVKIRDLYEEGVTADPAEFLFYYKTYIAGVLGGRYDVSSLQKSGLEPLKNEKEFAAFYNAESIDVLCDELRKRQESVQRKEAATKVKVSKGIYRWKTIASIAFPVLFVITLAFLLFFTIVSIPRKDTLIQAMEDYIASDYAACIHDLQEVEIEDMDKETKYILAVSYAKTENLKKEEIAGIVSRLSINSDERELEYWIYLGRMETEEAEETAQSLSDDKLLIYAYMKELDILKKDTSKSGSEKQNRINELESSIQSLGEKYNGDNLEDEGIDESNTEGSGETSNMPDTASAGDAQ